MSVNAYTYVGFEVSASELWSIEVAEKETCPKGHPKEGEATFCSQCGGKLGRQQKTVLSEGAVRLLKVLGVEGPYDKLEAYELSELGIGVNVSAVTSGEEQSVCLAVIVRLTEVDDEGGWHQEKTACRNRLEVLLAFDQVETLRAALLGDKPREVRLFTQLYF